MRALRPVRVELYRTSPGFVVRGVVCCTASFDPGVPSPPLGKRTLRRGLSQRRHGGSMRDPRWLVCLLTAAVSGGCNLLTGADALEVDRRSHKGSGDEPDPSAGGS